MTTCMQADLADLVAQQASRQSQLGLFQEEKKKCEEDADVPLRLKQGQVEVEPQGIVDSNLDNAVLVALQLVQVCLQAGINALIALLVCCCLSFCFQAFVPLMFLG